LEGVAGGWDGVYFYNGEVFGFEPKVEKLGAELALTTILGMLV